MPHTTFLSLLARRASRGVAVGALLFAPIAVGSAHAGAQRSVTVHGVLQVNGFSLGANELNEPVLPCGFNVSFYGYDVGVAHAAIVVTPMVPTVGGLPISEHVTWATSTRTSAHQLDQNVIFSPALLANAFANATSTTSANHALISVQITDRAHSSLLFHAVWITSCAPAPAPSSVGSSANSVGANVPTSTGSLAFVVGATQRVGGTDSGYTSTPTRLVVGEQMQFHVAVVNTGSEPLLVSLRDALCDPLTLTPTPPQLLNPGDVVTYFCSHLFVTAPPSRHVVNVAVVSATSGLGAPLAPVRGVTTTVVTWPAYVAATP
ncbi:MAG: hypothetical protein KGJ42_05495 [Acidobacteriota bacterium]|nr:hypothetical protein [Acidobacteriota bacterium]